MNPVRTELEFAVKAAINEYGVKAHQPKKQAAKQVAKQTSKKNGSPRPSGSR